MCNGALIDFDANEWFSLYVNGEGKVCISTTAVDATADELCGSIDTATGDWMYVVADFDSNTATRKIIINGALDAEKPGWHSMGIGLGNQRFGTVGSNNGKTTFFTGDISKVLLYAHQHGSLKLLLDASNYDSSPLWKDVSGLAHNGKIANFMSFTSPTFAPVTAAGPPNFDFTGTQIIALDNIAFPNQLQGLTAAIYFKSTYTCMGDKCNFSLMDFDRSRYFGMYMEGDGRLTFTTSGLDSTRRSLTSTIRVNDGNWHWLVVTFDAATSKKRLFVDGFIQAEQSGLHSMGVGTNTAAEGFVGGGSEAGDFNQGRGFTGQVAKVLLYTSVTQTRETDHCDECAPGRFGFPDCERCNAAYCNLHGSAQLSADQSTCSCTCDSNTNWNGGRCETCDAPAKDPATNGGNCDECEFDGTFVRNDPASCFQCTNQDHCSNHADQVAADATNTGCSCTCSNGWSSADCSTCGPEYAASPPGDCNECAVGYVNIAASGQPSCSVCTVASHCSGNAVSVTSAGGLATQCDCACSNKWTGSDCSTCTTGYDASGDCATCAVGFVSTSPLTIDCVQCDVSANCGGNAFSVTTTPDRAACLCFCNAGYIGATCSSCGPTGVNGYVEVSNQCVRCTIAADCTATGTETVSADGGVCKCGCKDQWTGDKCDSCPTQFEQVSCNKCSVGYINYPTCDQCTVQSHCSGHATSVTSDATNENCINCQCTNSWTGSICDSCAAIFSGPDCDQCDDGRFNYDTCTLCTVKLHCSNHASAVTSDSLKTKCDCNCNNAWTGDSCDTCPPGIDAALDCSQCLAGFIGYPNCVRCTTATHCSGKADSVTNSPDFLSCQCDCRNMWSGSTCAQCNSQFAGSDCDQCAPGKQPYPICDMCTVVDQCENHASSVTAIPDPNPTSCQCNCRNNWEQPDCSTCPIQFGGADCDTCGAHRIGSSCTLCTVSSDCNGHASTVTSNQQQTECVCTCNQRWTGPDCSSCPSEYGGVDCNECAVGRINYPSCVVCTNTLFCNNHATAVSTDASKTTCECTCDPKYTGATCDQCAAGYINYPTCQQCSTATHCSGHAISVTSNQGNTVCSCQCSDKWQGSQCQTCPSRYEQAACNSCAAGHINFASGCEACSVSTHCSDHASTVTSNTGNTDCNCNCSNSWTGATCSTCDVKYGGSDCQACAPGHINYDTCTQCTLAGDCSNNAISVSSDVEQKNCVCNCKNEFTGSSCQTCPAAFTGTQCDQCATGRVSYPTCAECSVAVHCSNHAVTVTPDAGQTTCNCQCSNFWVGPTCSICPTGYGGVNCDECGTGYITPTQPSCTKCAVDVHCNGHASSTTSSSDHSFCQCQCVPGFTGPTCDKCDDGYIGYTTPGSCTQCTSADCNSNSKSVTSNTGNTACVCSCDNSWTGAVCDGCASQFDSSATGKCGKCTVGYINYPTCTECDAGIHCSGHASSATTVSGCFTNLGLGCCSDTKTVLTAGYFGSLADCQQKCRDTPNCGSIEHGWKNFQTYCTVIQAGTCQYHGVDTCGTKPANDGVATHEFDSTCYNDRCECSCSAQWEGIYLFPYFFV